MTVISSYNYSCALEYFMVQELCNKRVVMKSLKNMAQVGYLGLAVTNQRYFLEGMRSSILVHPGGICFSSQPRFHAAKVETRVGFGCVRRGWIVERESDMRLDRIA
jgi:hypothetical protein